MFVPAAQCDWSPNLGLRPKSIVKSIAPNKVALFIRETSVVAAKLRPTYVLDFDVLGGVLMYHSSFLTFNNSYINLKQF